jgi:hypothetical protein
MLRYFDTACRGGTLGACIRLASIFKDGGPGVPADPARASEYPPRVSRSRAPNASPSTANLRLRSDR